MQYWGNKEILSHKKTAFLSSQKCPAEVILKSYDWAKEQRETGNCIICGNHSQIEKDVFEILLKGEQPLILVLPRSLKKRWEPRILKAVNQNRLLVISPFDDNSNSRIIRENAIKKNETIISLGNKIVVGFKSKNGQLEKLLKEIEHKQL
ncbi:MAG: DNA-binding protein [Candidatus Delongbacteria bacterium]|nr:DNA-binding protein [Candidatus Delongbacteria bacterium]